MTLLEELRAARDADTRFGDESGETHTAIGATWGAAISIVERAEVLDPVGHDHGPACGDCVALTHATVMAFAVEAGLATGPDDATDVVRSTVARLSSGAPRGMLGTRAAPRTTYEPLSAEEERLLRVHVGIALPGYSDLTNVDVKRLLATIDAARADGPARSFLGRAADGPNAVPATEWREAEHAALVAGTHVPAVDDFGNQYLAPAQPQKPLREGIDYPGDVR